MTFLKYKDNDGFFKKTGMTAFSNKDNDCCLKTGIMTAFFHASRNVCLDKVRLKMNLRNGAKISEQPFTTNLGTPSSPTDSVARSRVIALLTSSSLTEATTDVSLHSEKGVCRTPEGVLL
jgi:hypothetical protein